MKKFEEFLRVLDAEKISNVDCIKYANIIAWDEEDAEYQRLLLSEDNKSDDEFYNKSSLIVEGLKSLLEDPYKLQAATDVLAMAPYPCSDFIDTYLKGSILYQNQLYQLYNQFSYIIDPKEETC